MKRRDLLAKLKQVAKDRGEELTLSEGGDHTKVSIGGRATTVPRHREINEFTARGIIKYLETKQ